MLYTAIRPSRPPGKGFRQCRKSSLYISGRIIPIPGSSPAAIKGPMLYSYSFPYSELHFAGILDVYRMMASVQVNDDRNGHRSLRSRNGDDEYRKENSVQLVGVQVLVE